MAYKEKANYVYKAIVIPHFEYCILAWRPYSKKYVDMFERIQRRPTKNIPELRYLCFEERLKRMWFDNHRDNEVNRRLD